MRIIFRDVGPMVRAVDYHAIGSREVCHPVIMLGFRSMRVDDRMMTHRPERTERIHEDLWDPTVE